MGALHCPTNPFTTLKHQNPSHDFPEQHKIRRSPDLEDQKLWKGSSGAAEDYIRTYSARKTESCQCTCIHTERDLSRNIYLHSFCNTVVVGDSVNMQAVHWCKMFRFVLLSFASDLLDAPFVDGYTKVFWDTLKRPDLDLKTFLTWSKMGIQP